MPHRVHFIVNPKGGVGDNESLAKRATEWLAEHGIESKVWLTTRAGHAREMVREMEWRKDDAVCGIGGDGTMYELVNGMMGRPEGGRVPLGLLPGGTGNSFLHDLDDLDPSNLIEKIARGERRRIDLFQVKVSGTVRYGFNIVGWAMFSTANQLAERLRCLGRRRYDAAALVQILRNRSIPGRLCMDDGEALEAEFTLMAIANTMHTGEGMKLAPKARIDDGMLDIIVVEKRSRRALIRLFSKLGSGRHVDEPGVRYEQVTRVRLQTEATIPLNIDGELVGSGPFEVQVLPGALEVLL